MTKPTTEPKNDEELVEELFQYYDDIDCATTVNQRITAKEQAELWLKRTITTIRQEAEREGLKRGLEQSQALLDDTYREAEERERERCVGIVGTVLSIKPTPTQLFTKIAREINSPTLQEASTTDHFKSSKSE